MIFMFGLHWLATGIRQLKTGPNTVYKHISVPVIFQFCCPYFDLPSYRVFLSEKHTGKSIFWWEMVGGAYLLRSLLWILLRCRRCVTGRRLGDGARCPVVFCRVTDPVYRM